MVTEGFTGNIALKTAEGTAKQLAAVLREAMSSSFSRSESDKRMEEVGLGMPLYY